MNYVTENITPIIAKQYLNTSRGNRPISVVTVNKYANAMKKGDWLLNGMCIIFDNEGHLIDGHHRLEAVIKAGIPVKFDVCRGVSNECFTTFDCGRHRTFAQVLAIQGKKHNHMLASIVMANHSIVKTGRIYGNTTSGTMEGKRTLSNVEKNDLYLADPEGFDAIAVIIVKLSSRCRIIPASYAGGMYYYLTHTGGYTEQEVFPFFEALFTLESKDIEVVNMLRNTITKSQFNGKKLTAESLWALLVKGWNNYITGKTPKLLRYSQSVEDLPKLITKN